MRTILLTACLLATWPSAGRAEILLSGKWGYSASQDKITDQVSHVLILDSIRMRGNRAITRERCEHLLMDQVLAPRFVEEDVPAARYGDDGSCARR